MTGEAIHTLTDADGDALTVYPPNAADPLPSVQIDAESYGPPGSGMVNYTPEQAPALARAILQAAGLTARVLVEEARPGPN